MPKNSNMNGKNYAQFGLTLYLQKNFNQDKFMTLYLHRSPYRLKKYYRELYDSLLNTASIVLGF